MLTLILAVIMVFSLSLTAFAAASPADQASGIALKDAGLELSQVGRLKTEKDGRNYEVEFVQKSSGTEYEYEISLTGKKIVEKSVEFRYTKNTSREKIGVKAARRKVAEFSGISAKTIKKGTCIYKYSDREGIYTFRFNKGSYRYEYEVLAPTGEVVEWSKELITAVR